MVVTTDVAIPMSVGHNSVPIIALTRLDFPLLNSPQNNTVAESSVVVIVLSISETMLFFPYVSRVGATCLRKLLSLSASVFISHIH